MSRRRPWPFFYAVVAALLALDQATKAWIVSHLTEWDQIVVVPHFFNLIFAQNTGVAFSLLQGKNMALLLAIGTALLLALAMIWRVNWTRPSTNWIAALLFAGALGNLCDRIRHGYVVDFLDFHWNHAHYPTFNVADSCITIAAVWLLILSLVKPSHERK